MRDTSKIRRRTRCPECNSLNIVKSGFQSGKQRYKCNECGKVFSVTRKDVSMSNRYPWFKKWVLGKQTIEDIADESGMSERQIRRWFDEILEKSPVWKIRTGVPVYMLIDGTWFHDGRCLIVYRNASDGRTIYYRLTDSEREYEISSDLMDIRTLGLDIRGFTTDGGEDITRAIKYVYPGVPRQRCLAHVERECLVWITQHPRTAAGIQLRRLVLKISSVQTDNDRRWWIQSFYKWIEDYEEFVEEKTLYVETGELVYTHDHLRKAYIHLKRALPYMFIFLHHENMPKTSNSLESFFGHLKDNLRVHRGLSPEHRDNFIKWYLYYRDEKKK